MTYRLEIFRLSTEQGRNHLDPMGLRVDPSLRPQYGQNPGRKTIGNDGGLTI
jgi:hypothetical protein